MAALLVLDAGLLATEQDLGREGHAALGVARSGAADPLSLRVGNRLVGNPDGAAALELTLRGGTLRCEDDVLLSLGGAPLAAVLEAPGAGPRPLTPWSAFVAPAGSLLRVGGSAWGVRAYLCAAGGFDVPPQLGSASTHVSSGLGGRGGRALRAGDRLAVRGSPGEGGARTLGPGTVAWLEGLLRRPALRATDGPHAARFSPGAVRGFWSASFTVSDAADRMGIRLGGPAVPAPADGGLTEPLPPGAVEVPPGGQPIVLLPDGPPTGGYPVLACVATVDLPRLGQARPHERIAFERVGLDEAREAYRERERRLAAEVPA
jgi:antagonist of KipI